MVAVVEGIMAVYFLCINIAGFAVMGIDKRRAKKSAFRISEASLFLTAFIGGGAGALAGMYFFRHKTKHWYFVCGMPFITILNAAAFAAVIYWAYNNM